VFVALASIVVGALGAIGQKNIKRLMAYSSINNVGFILIGLAAANVQGASAMLFYLVLYIAMTVAGFAAMLMLKDENGNQVEEIAKFSGLSRTRPGLALALAIVMFSLAGIPPLFGFWGKFLVFKAAVDADMMALAFLGFAASVIGAFYYLKIVKVIYFDEPADAVKGENDIWHKAILVVTCVFISPLGYLASGWLQGLTDTAATALFQAL
jgi:NADH-quinone oxidoreductase subunit N